MSEERWITVPKPSPYIDSETGKPIKGLPDDWEATEDHPRPTKDDMVDHPDRSFQWVLHTYILSHPIFSMEIGGFDAIHSKRKISKAAEDIEPGKAFPVTANQIKMLQATMARLESKHEDDKIKVAKSSRGMAKMSSLDEEMLFEQFEAIMNPSTKGPKPALESEPVPLLESPPDTPEGSE